MSMEARYYPRSKIMMISGGSFTLTMKIEDWPVAWRLTAVREFKSLNLIKTTEWELAGAYFHCKLQRKGTTA